MSEQKPTIIYTETDEAPALGTGAGATAAEAIAATEASRTAR